MSKIDNRYNVTKQAPNGKTYGGYKVFTNRAKALAEARFTADLLPAGWITRCNRTHLNGQPSYSCIWMECRKVKLKGKFVQKGGV